ncbi:MAG: hypothetical protein GTN81_04715 [Proteobacteria bacterium]|nr:hypothetical protein [Pseudomonadota bacterium]
MNSTDEIHLNDDQILKTVVDEKDLPATVREHLSGCRLCRAKKDLLEENLAKLGRMAERASPSPRRRVSLPAQKRRSPRWWVWGWQGALVATMSIVAAILVVSWFIVFRTESEESTAVLIREMWEDEKLMTEIRALEENPLSYVYREISGGSYPVLDDGFMEFVVPSVEDDTISLEPQKRGAALC